MATAKSKKTNTPARKTAARAHKPLPPSPAVNAKAHKQDAGKTPQRVAEVAKQPKNPHFNAHDLAAFRNELMALRDHLTGQVAKMRQDSLKRDDEVNPEEDGTDAFDRLFVLEQAGSGQERIFVIDEALRAIDEGHYGQCEGCGQLIEKPRLQALPFAKNCVKCQSAMERNVHGVPRRVIL